MLNRLTIRELVLSRLELYPFKTASIIAFELNNPEITTTIVFDCLLHLLSEDIIESDSRLLTANSRGFRKFSNAIS